MPEVVPIPKPTREKMTPRKWATRRDEVWEREMGLCQGCRSFVPLTDGHLHHIKSRGAGGSHGAENLAWLCWKCHRGIHDGRMKL